MSDKAPNTKRVPFERSYHGKVFVDNYEWLRDKESPETVAWITAQNDFTEKTFESQQPLRDVLFQEIKSRVQETDTSLPSKHKNWWYNSRSQAGKNYSIQTRIPVDPGNPWDIPILDEIEFAENEQVYFDGNIEAEGHEYFSVGTLDISDDGNLLLYGIDTTGAERYDLRIRDLQTGEDFADFIPKTAAGASFSFGGEYVFYLTPDEAWRQYQIWRHKVGTPATEDELVYEEKDERFWLNIDGTDLSNRYFVFSAGSKNTSEIWVQDINNPLADLVSVWGRREGIDFDIDISVFAGEELVLITHNQNSPDFEVGYISASDIGVTPPVEAKILLPPVAGTRYEGVASYRDFVLVDYRKNSLSSSGIIFTNQRIQEAELQDIPINEELYSASASGGAEWDTPTYRLGYGSFATPASIWEVTASTGERKLLKQVKVLGGYDPKKYQQRRVWAEAPDGTKIPVSLVWSSEYELKNLPTLIYGYGAYEHSIDPYLSVPRISLLDRGILFAIAHVRGGGEMGRAWYEQGKLFHKQNTFSDFIAATKMLISERISNPERILASGGSAGGLLMGAIANQAPELYSAIHLSVPFVDALTTILHPEYPLTVTEWEEWGNPLADEGVYDYMASYSPYENLREGVEYPHMLITTGFNDTRVFYVEPAKYLARLQELGQSAFMRTEMTAGHGSKSGRYEVWKEIAWENAWAISELLDD
ncbi:MAG: S9 family peptidase [Microbacteriaceae bacterium]|nr:S9 family peptidase [Microbacteriaceae bacterium]